MLRICDLLFYFAFKGIGTQNIPMTNDQIEEGCKFSNTIKKKEIM